MFPRVLAVERQGDERLGLGVSDAGDQVLGRLARLAPGVAEADPIRQLAVAKKHRDRPVRAGDVGVVVPRIPVGQRRPQLELAALEHALIRRAPAHAAGGEQVDRLGADRSFRRPHPFGRSPERRARGLQPARHVLARVLRIREARRERDTGHGAAGDIGIDHQRQDGMVERRAGELDLAAFRQRAPAWHDAGGDPPLPVERKDLLLLRIASLLRDQLGDARLLAARGESHPGEDEMDLHVAQLLRAEFRLAREQVDLPQVRAALVEQLRISSDGTQTFQSAEKSSRRTCARSCGVSSSAGLRASCSSRSWVPEAYAASCSSRDGAQFATARTWGWRSSASAMSVYAREACWRTHGKMGWPVCGSRYSGWCRCQRKTARTGISPQSERRMPLGTTTRPIGLTKKRLRSSSGS